MLELDLMKFNLSLARKCYKKSTLCKEAGISYDNLMKILGGRTALTPYTLGKISKVLEVEPEELIVKPEERR